MTNRIFLDVHAIQTLPPSNINRDDTGSPKTAQYGGIRRARVSSQSWKKAIRDYFYKNGEIKNVGVRSLDIVKYVADKIVDLDSSIDSDQALKMADDVINKAGVKTKEFKVKALFFLGDIQARELAQAAIAENFDKKYLKGVLKDNPAIDIALFGRMVADDPSLNEDASCQVAHAISTHGIQTEFDFYTAVDDLSPEDNAGAGMLGTIEFNSSTLYRYANIAVHELVQQLESKEATINTIKLFIEAFSNSLPTGKVNTFANQTLPQLIFVSLRTDRPVNLVTAFEVPVKSIDGYVNKSIEKLFDEYDKVKKFVKEPVFNAVLLTEEVKANEDIKEVENMDKLLGEISNKLEELVPEK
ncbi:MAG: type I-E CRISPR-associated protein Cas7/Cse4/CasC [Bacillota bacterium]|nr:type I-E CRISPR-associated protein Cas7/Cse4/CasC [Bacillota bacterium]